MVEVIEKVLSRTFRETAEFEMTENHEGESKDGDFRAVQEREAKHDQETVSMTAVLGVEPPGYPLQYPKMHRYINDNADETRQKSRHSPPTLPASYKGTGLDYASMTCPFGTRLSPIIYA